MPGVKHDPNNQRPRYLGLKVRAKGPPKLAVVAGVAAARGALGNMVSSARDSWGRQALRNACSAAAIRSVSSPAGQRWP